MAKFVAKPVEVEAFEIIDAAFSHSEKIWHLRLDNGKIQFADAPMVARMTPKVGDYWVVQEDGYTYLNPREVFQRKYTPKPDALDQKTS